MSSDQTALLTTKIFPPPVRPNHVYRPRLSQLLEDGLTCAFTLISAPPGFGKTALIGAWNAEHARMATPQGTPSGAAALRLAWLSLDAADNEPAQFLRYLIAALRTAQPTLGETMHHLLQTSQPPTPIAVISALLNELSSIAAREPSQPELVLLLDDYHVIETRAICEAMVHFIERLPASAHIFMTTRADPPFPLSRWRASGRMVEIRQSDLRFTQNEIAALLSQSRNLKLSASDVAVLEARTEGWVAALQLAMLATRNESDAERLIAALAGQHRYVMDYLTDEVLDHQPVNIQAFLLSTCVLDRMCDELCASMLGSRSNGPHPTLAQLERANVFVTPLDDERHWYRYHHLFAEALRSRLRRGQTSRIDELHRHASVWFSANGFPDEAIHHAIAGKDFAAAASLIEAHAEHMLSLGGNEQLRRLIEALPGEIRAARPRILIFEAHIHARAQRLDIASNLLETVERAPAFLEASDDAKAALRAEVDAVRTLVLIGQSRFNDTITVGERALAHLPSEAVRQRASALQQMGYASNWLGNTRESVRYFREMKRLAAEHGDAPSVFSSELNLIGVEGTPRNLRQTRDRLMALHAYAQQHGLADSANGAATLRFLASVEYELDNPVAAITCADQAIDIAVRHQASPIEVMSRCSRALSLSVLSRFDEALAEVGRAGDLVERFQMAARYSALVNGIRLIMWLRAGHLSRAAEWIKANPLDLRDFVSVRAIEYRMHARVKMLQGDYAAASALMACIFHSARENENDNYLYSALLIQTVLHQLMGNAAGARETLTRALEIGEPERLTRSYLDLGAPMRAAVGDWRAKTLATPENARLIAYADVLLAAFGATPQKGHTAQSGVMGMLSEREIEILRMVMAGMSNQAIADKLFVAVGTVKKHLYNIYGKLGATSRTQAIAKARESGLV